MKKIQIYYLFDDKKLKSVCFFPNAYIKMHELLTKNGYELAPGAGTCYWSTDCFDDLQTEIDKLAKLFDELSQENPWFDECITKLEISEIEKPVDLKNCFMSNGELDDDADDKK